MGMQWRDGQLPAWPEVRRILDNENIPLEQRRTLALRYFSNVADESPTDLSGDEPTDYGFDSEEQFSEIRKRYEQKLDVADKDPDDEDDGDVMAAYTKAHNARDRLQNQQLDDLSKSIQGDKQELAALERSSSKTGVSASVSDEILALGKHALDEIALLNPVYGRAVLMLGEDRQNPRMSDLSDEYYEQAGIPFGKFTTAAAELDTLREAVAECWADQSGRMGAVFANWSGAGAESAHQSWQGIRTGKEQIEESLRNCSEAVTRSAAAVAKSCRDKAGWMIEYRTSAQYGPAYPYFDLQRLCDIAELARAASDNDVLHFANRMPPYLSSTIQEESGDLAGEHKDAAAEWAKTVLRGFTKWFDQYIDDFNQMCDNEFDRVNGIWDKLTEVLAAAPTDAFSGNADAAQRSVPNGSTGGGVAVGVPETGEPSVAEMQDTVTVSHGDHSSTLSEPDAEGAMSIAIGDGSEQPRTFELDSSEGSRQTSPQGWFGDVFGDPGTGVTPGVTGGDPEEAGVAPFGDGVHSGVGSVGDGTAGLGTAPGGGVSEPSESAHGSNATSMRGMGMMGAGMMGAGEAQQRTSSFLVDDMLFDIGDTGCRISGTIEEAVEDEPAVEQPSSAGEVSSDRE